MSGLVESWEALAGEMLNRRIALERAAPRIYPLQPFGHKASDAEIAAAESRLGHPLDALHVELLKRVNGWPDVFADADLLGADDLGQGERWSRAQSMIFNFYEDGPGPGCPARASIYPIHLAEATVFAIDVAGALTDGGHPVYWLDGGVIDQWPNVREFWRAGFTLLEQGTQYITQRLQEIAEGDETRG